MKILKIFGLVVGIHVFALVLIFANPGCSSTTKPPAPSETAMRTETPSTVSVPSVSAAPVTPAPADATASSAGVSSPLITFDPNAPATAAPSRGGDPRYTPTRPGTPAAGTLVSEPVLDVTPATTYTVKSGDTLSAIAKKHHVTVAELAAANSIKPSAILRPNQKLLIPGKPASPSAAAVANPASAPPKNGDSAAAPAAASRGSGKELRHTVKSGESLSTIAKFYGVPAREIAVANNIADPARINAGTELIIPGWEPTAKAGKSASKGTKASKETKTTPPPAIEQPVPTQPPPTTQPPPVPVIRIDDAPISPAPKN